MAPTLYRIILQVDNLDRAEEFYGKLLGDRGRRIPRASRHYIDCGPVILALVDVRGEDRTKTSAAAGLHLLRRRRLDAVHGVRAIELPVDGRCARRKRGRRRSRPGVKDLSTPTIRGAWSGFVDERHFSPASD